MLMLLTAAPENSMLKVNKRRNRRVHDERRQSPRYRLQDGSLVINSTILGPILDLSLHGMSFEYYADDLEDARPGGDIGIFISHSKLLLTGLETRVIRDSVIGNNSSFLPVIRKTRAVEFICLSSEQRRQILQIIATQAVDLP